MELKEMIDGLQKLAGNEAFYLSERDRFSAAAEALALVAWAETNVTEIVPLYGGKWRCYTILNKGMGDSILGAIRAAKEAHEAQ